MPVLPWSENDAGLFTFDGSNRLALVSDFNYWYADFTDVLGQNNDAGTYTMDTNGQVAASINGLPFSCWAIFPDEMICIDTVSNQDTLPILMKFDRVSGGG